MEQYFHALIRGERRGWWAALQRRGLQLASVPYSGAVRLRNWLFDKGWKRSARAPVPVVSVGNLTLGGTGKTPCVEYVARFYRRHDVRVAILSRGYGSDSGRNDEAMVLEENLPDVPHLQGADRVALAQVAVDELESQLLILDDGFQHRRLARDLDLVLIDATAPWGHDHLFPRGLLREPPSSLRRAGIVVLTRCDQVSQEQRRTLAERVLRIAPHVPVIETSHRPAAWINAERKSVEPARFSRRPVAGFCGIGNPDAFQRTLANLGAQVTAFRAFPDHHNYTRANLDDLRTWVRQQAKDCIVVTTHKDLVKLQLTHLGERELWALQIQLHIDAGQQALDERLYELVMTSDK